MSLLKQLATNSHLVASENEALEMLTSMIEAGKDRPYCEVMTITPPMAEVLLKLNPDNRPMKERLLRTIEADIKSGNYVLNGESIILSVDGTVNDGQHRLQAVLNAGIAIESMVCFGLSRDTRLTVDTGTVRSTADFLAMKGVERGRQAGIAARLLSQYERFGTVSETATTTGPMIMTKAQIQEQFYAKRKEIEDALATVPSKGSGLFGQPGMIAFVFIVLARRDRVAAREFIELLFAGSNLPDGHPILVARNRFMFDKKAVRTTLKKLELLFRAWNMWRGGVDKVKQIPIMDRLPELSK